MDCSQKNSYKKKKCVRKDGKEFSFPRRFSQEKCLINKCTIVELYNTSINKNFAGILDWSLIGGDGNEAGAALSQPPRKQHQLAEAVHVLDVSRPVIPLFADAIDVHQLRGVVALDQLGILF